MYRSYHLDVFVLALLINCCLFNYRFFTPRSWKSLSFVQPCSMGVNNVVIIFVQKPHGYHLDVFVLALLIMVCSILGLPWFVAATVRSVTHVRSLLQESEVKIPGEKTQIIGAR